jgi:hypothetical protein
MSVSSDVKNFLETTDPTLTTDVLTGGIYDWNETGRMGITGGNVATSDAFDGPLLSPCALIKFRGWNVGGGIVDEANQIYSAFGTLEVYIYNESDIDVIETAIDRIATALSEKKVATGVTCQWRGQSGEMQAEELNGAAMMIMYFRLLTIKEF